jgi:hypothetical protein
MVRRPNDGRHNAPCTTRQLSWILIREIPLTHRKSPQDFGEISFFYFSGLNSKHFQKNFPKIFRTKKERQTSMRFAFPNKQTSLYGYFKYAK